MKIAVVFGSNRKNGTSLAIENKIKSIEVSYEYDFIRMADVRIEGCLACANCSKTGKCIIRPSDNDMFEFILNKLSVSDKILIITPIYSPFPSKLVAFMERLLSISYFPYEYNKRARPLNGKSVGIVCYGSCKIEDEKQLKLLFQKCLMDNYSFTDISYDYINKIDNPNSIFNDVVDYVEYIIKNM